MSKFKELLKNKRIKQETLARELGVHQTLISQWCNGKGKPNIYQVVEVAKYIGVSAETIISCFTGEGA